MINKNKNQMLNLLTALTPFMLMCHILPWIYRSAFCNVIKRKFILLDKVSPLDLVQLR